MKKTGVKRGISMVGVAAMAISMMVMPVSAAEDNSMSVEYGKTTSYVLSIPASITLSDQSTVQSTSIGVSSVNTTPTQKVQVKIKSGISDNKVELTRDNDGTTKVVSTVNGKNASTIENGTVVAEFKDMSAIATDTNAGELNFSAISDADGATVKAGTYKGTIVFEGAVVNR